MTNIQGPLTYADGSPASGRLVIYWKPFVVSNVSVAGGELEFFIVDGQVSLSLYSNANALPVGSYYNAKYELENGSVYVEQWIVPNVATANLGQVRVSFPPSPSVIISPLQLGSLNAQPGMFLMWDGNKWVPGYPSYFNINPNYISVVAASSGSDVNITGSPVALGGVVTINVPDAGPAARGVVTTGAQTFAGNKTFTGSATMTNLTITGTVTLPPNSYVPASRQVLTGVGLTGGGDLTADRTLSVVNDTVTERVRVSSAGTLVATRQEINFISGANATVVVVDDTPANNRVNITVGSTAFADPTTAKGDMLARSASALTRLAVGADGQILTADSTQLLGVKWATAVGQVASVFGRTGAVVAASGDYSAFYVPLARQVLAGTGLTGGGALSVDVTLNAVAMGASGASHAAGMVPDPGATAGVTRFLREDATWQAPPSAPVTSVFTRTGAVVAAAGDYSAFYVPLTCQVLAGAGLSGGGALSGNVTLTWPGVQAALAGAVQGTEPELNFIAGSGTTLSVTDISASKRVDITIGLSGTGPPTNSVYSVNGTTIGTRSQLNLISGASIALTGVDNSAAGRVDITIAATVMGASGAAHVAGTVPDPGATVGTTRYLREDATWAVPPGGTGGVTSISPGNLAGAVTLAGGANISVTQSAQTITIAATGVVTSVFTRTGAVVAAAADYSAYYVSLTGSYASPSWLTQVNWSIITGVPSTVISPLTTKGDIHVFGPADTRLPIGTTANWVLMVDSTQPTGMKWAVVTPALIGAVPTTTTVSAGAGLSGGGALSANITLAAVPLGASGASHAAGIAPDPGSTAGTTRFLREDATWQAPPAAPVTSVFGRTGAVVAVATDYTPAFIGAVPTTIQVIAGAGLSGGGALSANVTLTAVALGASGASHSAGIAPDPGSTAGTTRYLREDATWAVPPGGAGAQTPWTSDINAAGFQLLNTGNVGIGTATPGARLEVDITDTVTNPFSVPALELKNTNTTVGNMTSIRNVNSGGGANAEINFINTGQGVYPNNGGAIAFSTYDGVGGGGTIKMYINPAGNVGIGTASPQVALQISRPSGQEASIAVFQLGIGSGHFGVKPSDSNVYLVNSYTTGTLAGSNGIVIDRNGNVGIGTASPLNLLTLAGASATPSLRLEATASTAYYWDIGRENVTTGDFVFNNANGGASSERMRITVAGNVGIGTTTPSSLLTVQGTAQQALVAVFGTNNGSPATQLQAAGIGLGPNASQQFAAIYGMQTALNSYGEGDLVLQACHSGALTERMRITAAGNVGIGTAAPASLLTVLSAANPTTVATSNQIAIGEYTNNASYRLSLGYGIVSGGSWAGVIQATGGGALTLLLNPSGGAVGIGLATPAYALDVTGDIRATSVYRGSAANGLTPLLYVAVSGGFNPNNLPANSMAFYLDNTNNQLGVWVMYPNGTTAKHALLTLA